MTVDAATRQLTGEITAVLRRVLDAGLAEREAAVTAEDVAARIVAQLTDEDPARSAEAVDEVLGWCGVREAPGGRHESPWWTTPLGALVRERSARRSGLAAG